MVEALPPLPILLPMGAQTRNPERANVSLPKPRFDSFNTSKNNLSFAFIQQTRHFFQFFHFHQAEDFDAVSYYSLCSAQSTKAHIRYCSRLIKMNVNCPHRSLPKRKSISSSDGSALWSHHLPWPKDAEFLCFQPRWQH